MTPRRLVAVALQSLRRHVLRGLLTVLGVVIGVGSVVVMVGIGEGAQAEIAARIASLGTHLVVVTPGATTRGGASGGAGTGVSLSLDDVDALRREAQTGPLVSPVIQTWSLAVVGNANWRTSIQGVGVDWFAIREWQARTGRVFDDPDVRSSRKVCMLGATVAENLFGDEDPVGRILRLRGVPLEIVGVLARKGQGPDGDDQDDLALVPYTTVRSRMAGRQFLRQILLRAPHADAVPELKRETAAILRDSHRLGKGAPDDFTVKDQAALAAASEGTTRVMTTLLLAVASISLLVGGIGIMNIMLVSVTERTREIGIRRALGARARDVLAQFLVEAVVLSGIGGLLGAALGVLAARIVGHSAGWSVVVRAPTVLIAVGFAAAVGVLFGWLPARRAARLHPIDALRGP
ncbi:MAG: hypothetical protein RLZZ299_1080 [Pseudomonadota bacterium]